MVTVWMAILNFMGLGWQFAFEQWVVVVGSGTNYNSPLPISLTHCGTVVGMDGSVPSISYAALLNDTHYQHNYKYRR